MNEELLQKIKEIANPDDDINLFGTPATDEEIQYAENELGIKFHDDYKCFIKNFGGAYAGIAIHAFRNSNMLGKETVIDLTKWARESFADDPRSSLINKSYVISDDGSGNPIMICEDGKVIIAYHDCDEYEDLAGSLSELLKQYMDE